MINEEKNTIIELARAVLSLTKATAQIAQKAKITDDETNSAINDVLKQLDNVANSIGKAWPSIKVENE